MSLCRPMVSTSFWVKPMQADRSSHPPSFLTLNRPPPSFQSIGIKDALHGSLLRECHCFPINWPTETVPYTLINKRPYIKEPPSERTPSKLSTYEILGPGMIILKNYVSFTDQVDIVNICEKWAAGPGGFYMYESDEDRRRQMCFGRNWEPETGYRNCYRSNGFKPPPVPHEFISLAEAAIKDAQLYLDDLPSMYPDTCLVSFYETNGRLGLHQDCDESSDSLRRGLPVVSISIGTSAIFVYGRTKRKRKLKGVCLDSGDILIFGGESRHIYHGVEQVSCFISTHGLYAESQMKLGRLSLTLRQF